VKEIEPFYARAMALELRPEADVLEQVVGWGEEESQVRALILTSTRAKPGGASDLLSDYDVIVAATDPDAFARDGAWLSAYGRPLARWGDSDELYGLATHFRGVVYEDGVKIDYTIWPVELLGRVARQADLPDRLDVGYRVLLDKDDATSRWAPPTFKAHIPPKPSEAEYCALVEEFWWGTTYAAKALWRDELLFAKFVLDYDLKLGALRRMLEWRLELEHDWSLVPGKLGQRLKGRLPADVWDELASTYVGPDIDDNWAALFRTTALFSRVAKDVGAALGYAYPQDAENGISAQLHAVRKLPPAA
jgi:aminoglycoside 6-adenylyltransferase